MAARLPQSSRLSQITRNIRRRTAEGLATGMFCLAIAGNLSYGASVILRVHTVPELVGSFPWVLGSLGTVALDLCIVGQTVAYGTGGGHHSQSRADSREQIHAVGADGADRERGGDRDRGRGAGREPAAGRQQLEGQAAGVDDKESREGGASGSQQDAIATPPPLAPPLHCTARQGRRGVQSWAAQLAAAHDSLDKPTTTFIAIGGGGGGAPGPPEALFARLPGGHEPGGGGVGDDWAAGGGGGGRSSTPSSAAGALLGGASSAAAGCRRAVLTSDES